MLYLLLVNSECPGFQKFKEKQSHVICYLFASVVPKGGIPGLGETVRKRAMPNGTKVGSYRDPVLVVVSNQSAG